MNFYIKNLGNNKAEAFYEMWSNEEMEWETVCQASLIITPDCCLIDTINTLPKYRRRGYATDLVKYLQTKFDKVTPIGVINTSEAKGFWFSLELEDGLGKER